MTYNQTYEACQPSSLFPVVDSNQQLSSLHSLEPIHDYTTIEGETNFDMYDDRPGFQGTSMSNTEEVGDAASRPRLTQEQLAQLERQFAIHHKPNTEYKKNLAENMGVDYSKVNNWFQNRRAKAKHENQAHLRSDPSFEDTHNFLPDDYANMGYRRMSGPQSSIYYSSPEQGPVPTDEFASCLDFSTLNDPHTAYNNLATPLMTNIGAIDRYDDGRVFESTFSTAVPSHASGPYPANSLYSEEKMPTTSIVELGPYGMSPESPPVPSYGFELVQGNPIHQGQQIYHNTHNGHLIGNPSSQSFVTSPSVEDDHTNLITPPQETSPLPGLNKATFQHDRRTSNDSELAENFDTIHLQQSQAGLGHYGSSNTAQASDPVSSTGLLTPVITPDTTDSKLPFATGNDLASRRNRRIPKLQSDSGRSFSCAAPGSSPRLRISPPGSGKMSPVRRIKSTGNNLNVVTGRIKKQGSTSAQLSPRNFEACFQVASLSDVQSSAGVHNHNREMSDSVPDSLTSPSPVAFDQRNNMEWIDSTSQFPVTPSPWHQGTTISTPLTHGPGHGWNPAQDEHSHIYAPTPIQQILPPQQYVYHCPPQSAPSHVTTFDAVSSMTPTMRTWQPPLMAPQPYRDDTQLSIPIRPYHPHSQSHGGPLSHFPSPPNHFSGYHPGMSSFQPFQQYLNRTPTPVLKPLEIKVETGPPPPQELVQASQERKEYTFQNSFSHDPDFATNMKK